MASLEDFRTKVAANADAAFRDYILHIDEMSLDYATGDNGELVPDAFKVVSIVFEFSDPNVITMRARQDNDPRDKIRKMSYLPWKNAGIDAGVAKATLDDKGPAYFSTSQLTGCRFTIQYGDASRKTATVLHLAGDVQGGKKPEGSATRDGLELANLPQGSDMKLRRRYSVGQMKPALFKKVGVESGTTLYYDGGKSAILGFRGTDGGWNFYAAEEKFEKGAGFRNLATGQSVTTSIATNVNG